MTTLIVGCGYLGRRVGRLLSDRGERVFGTVRTSARAVELAAWGVEPVVANVNRPESLGGLPESDRVLYCVGFDRSAGIPMRTVYVDGLSLVLRALRGRTNRIVYASATSVYGHNDGGWVTEDSPTEPTTESGRVCLDAETFAGTICTAQGQGLVVVRYSGLYGPDRVLRRAALERGEPITGDPTKYLNLIHIDDAASAAVVALERGESGRVYLATDDRPVERQEYYRLAAELLEAPTPRFISPAPGSPESLREEANKRVSNRRIKEELGLSLAYPEITQGLPAAFLAG